MTGELVCCDGCLTVRATVRLIFGAGDDIADVFCCWNCSADAIQHHGAQIAEVMASGPWQVPR